MSYLPRWGDPDELIFGRESLCVEKIMKGGIISRLLSHRQIMKCKNNKKSAYSHSAFLTVWDCSDSLGVCMTGKLQSMCTLSIISQISIKQGIHELRRLFSDARKKRHHNLAQSFMLQLFLISRVKSNQWITQLQFGFIIMGTCNKNTNRPWQWHISLPLASVTQFVFIDLYLFLSDSDQNSCSAAQLNRVWVGWLSCCFSPCFSMPQWSIYLVLAAGALAQQRLAALVNVHCTIWKTAGQEQRGSVFYQPLRTSCIQCTESTVAAFGLNMEGNNETVSLRFHN